MTLIGDWTVLRWSELRWSEEYALGHMGTSRYNGFQSKMKWQILDGRIFSPVR